jgi:murein DD-endopeptidase MepM/ murein hydrolase activator NlpD
MIRSVRTVVLLPIVLITAFIGYKIYFYFGDKTAPEIVISGVENNGHYCGDVQCSVNASKSGELSVKMDGQSLFTKYKVSRSYEQTFPIPTRSMPNGAHSMKIEYVDSTFNKNKVTQEINFVVDNVPLQAAFVKADSDYKVFQGRTLHVQFQVNKDVKDAEIQVLSKGYPCYPEAKNSLIYETYVPIPCEETPNEYLFTVAVTDRVGNTLNLDNRFQIVAFPFKKQTIKLDPEKVKHEHEVGIDSAEREAILEKLALQSPKEKLWRGAFCTPIDIQQITCEFGSVRTTQEKGRYMHKALDVYNAPRSVVWAPQDGIVVLKDRYADAGNTVVIDHGFGVLSLFYHLEDFSKIEVGQKVAKGNPIGTIGKTGYATGYHLHWEQRINNVAVDPMQWTKQNF